MPTRVKLKGYTLEVALDKADKANIKRFDAKRSNYLQKLQERPDINSSLRVLLARLFLRRAITRCVITYGDKMELTLLERSPRDGKPLSPVESLRRFQEIFSAVTGLKLRVDWTAPSGRDCRAKWRRRHHGLADVKSALVEGFDDVLDGVLFETAIKLMFSGR